MSEKSQVFGLALDQLNLCETGVPTFLPIVRDFIISNSKNEGIFRRCGNHQLIQELGTIFTWPEAAIPPCHTVFEVSGFLKQWLNSLPAPIISPDIAAAFLKNSDNPQSAIETLKRIRPLNRKTAAYIFSIIKAVLEQSDINKMNYANIQRCFITSVTQNQKGIYPAYPFTLLYVVGVRLLNDTHTDFILEGPLVEEVIQYYQENKSQIMSDLGIDQSRSIGSLGVSMPLAKPPLPQNIDMRGLSRGNIPNRKLKCPSEMPQEIVEVRPVARQRSNSACGRKYARGSMPMNSGESK